MRRDGLAARREAKGFSQEALARRVGVHRTTVQRWENGTSNPYPWQRPQLATALELGIADVQRLLAREQHDTPERLSAPVDGIEAIELIRRAEATDVGARTLMAIAQAIDQIALTYTHTPPTASLPTLLAYQQYLGRLLDGRATLSQRTELMRHAGWLSLLVATAHMDLGHDIAAAANLLAARSLAAEVGDLSLDVWAVETQAWHALSRGSYQQAAVRCQEGLDIAEPGTSAYVQLCTQTARVSARLGDRPATHRLVDESLTAVTALPAGRTGHHFELHEKRVVANCAAALVWLGEPGKAAEEYARRAVAEFDDTEAHHLATARMNLGLVLARSDEPDEATQLGHLALDASWRLCRTDRFLAADLDGTLTSLYPASREVVSFHERFLGSDCFDQREPVDLADLPQLEAGRDH